MPALPVIAVFDVGKTNKKLLLFNERYEVVFEQETHLPETVDEDGFPCENVESLRAFLHDSLRMVFQKSSFDVKAINVAAYGASFVNIDASGEPCTPLYNYLKPYPQVLQNQLYEMYGGADAFAVTAASPLLGSLNSGLQLYRIKQEQPQVFEKIKHSLHLPQYVSYLLTAQAYSDITSIGCHTALWDFEKVQYHQWVRNEGLLQKLAPIHPTEAVLRTVIHEKECAVGIGVHDSSAALIPYHTAASEPFLLLSTGTWCIALNPFNNVPLTAAELAQDCLCYLDYKGRPVKAARILLGPQYDAGVKRIAAYFHQDRTAFIHLSFDAAVLQKTQHAIWGFEKVPFAQRELHQFENATEAYYALLLDLMRQQYASVNLVRNDAVKQLFVDGGFSKNDVYMNLLAAAFPELNVFAASMAQGTALGAALAIHASWNAESMSPQLVPLKKCAPACRLVL